MSEFNIELDKKAVRERLGDIQRSMAISRSVCSACFELFEEGRHCVDERFLRDLDVLEAAGILMQRAEDMLNDLIENPPTIDESAETANETESGDSSSIRRAGTLS